MPFFSEFCQCRIRLVYFMKAATPVSSKEEERVLHTGRADERAAQTRCG